MKNVYPKKVKIVEVGPRDGLQNEKEIIPTDVKTQYIKKLVESGLSNIEITSFVNPDRVPQMKDAKELSLQFQLTDGFSCLVPNMKGLNAAIEAGYKKIAIFTAASETFNKKNINMSIAESIQNYSEVVKTALKNQIIVRVYVSTSFFCPYEKDISSDQVIEVTKKLIDLGIDDFSFGDTIGAACPKDVYNLLPRLLDILPAQKIAMHFHDTYGTALSNVFASLEHGISIFDTSSGGLGGCPYAPGAAGNLATEDLIYFLDKMGIQSNVDLNKVFQASKYIQDYIKKPLPSKQFQRLKSGVNC